MCNASAPPGADWLLTDYMPNMTLLVAASTFKVTRLTSAHIDRARRDVVAQLNRFTWVELRIDLPYLVQQIVWSPSF